MQAVLKLIVNDNPGVLDRLAGLLRRMGWNVNNLTAAEIGGGLTQISITFSGQRIESEPLNDQISHLDGVQSWEFCDQQHHILRELLLVCFPCDLQLQRKFPELRVIREIDKTIYAEYTGTPEEIREMRSKLSAYHIAVVTSGALVFRCGQEEAQ